MRSRRGGTDVGLDLDEHVVYVVPGHVELSAVVREGEELVVLVSHVRRECFFPIIAPHLVQDVFFLLDVHRAGREVLEVHQEVLVPWVQADRDTLLVERVHDTTNEEHAPIRRLLGQAPVPIMRRLGGLGIPLRVDEDEVGDDDDLGFGLILVEFGDDFGYRIFDDGVDGLNGLVDGTELVVEFLEVDGCRLGGHFGRRDGCEGLLGEG